MEWREAFLFGDGFRLELGRDAPGRKVLKLFRKNNEVPDVLNPTLELLHYFVLHPHQELLSATLRNALWPDSLTEDIVDKHVHLLRRAFKDDPENAVYIKTLHGRGYEFLKEAKREGGGIEAYPKWDRARFYAMMNDLRRGPEDDEEDLRIVTSAMGASLDELDIKGLLQRRVRIKILFLNPENKALVHARLSLRKDKPASRLLRELTDQLGDIQAFAVANPPSKDPTKGSVDFAVSDIMPCGFVAHTRERALLGIFPCHDSFITGPMVEMLSGSEPWQVLKRDFEDRWNDALAKRSGRQEQVDV